jgi:CubicO group peptidase (beta-lactamase class C family)
MSHSDVKQLTRMITECAPAFLQNARQWLDGAKQRVGLRNQPLAARLGDRLLAPPTKLSGVDLHIADGPVHPGCGVARRYPWDEQSRSGGLHCVVGANREVTTGAILPSGRHTMRIAVYRFRFVVVWFALQVLTTSSAAKEVVVRDVSDHLQNAIERHNIPGMAAAVAKESIIIASGAAGVRERHGSERVTLNDQFHLGSETKAMTATLCAMLVEEGKLRWDTTVGSTFPDLNAGMLPEYRQVTLKQLLTHRSGFRSEVLGDPEIMQTQNDFEKVFPGTTLDSRRASVKYLLSRNAGWSPNNEFIYSNANYVIAGHMVETVAGTTWEDLIQERLFKPLGMSSAGFGAPGHAELLDQPRGHRADGRSIEPRDNDADNPDFYGPSGRVHCKVIDWAKFAAFHATEGRSCPGLLKPESFAVLHAPVSHSPSDPNIQAVAPGASGYAMGWFVFPPGLLTHSGTNMRWFAEMTVVPKDQLSVVVACNQGGAEAEKGCIEAMQELINDYYRIRPTR